MNISVKKYGTLNEPRISVLMQEWCFCCWMDYGKERLILDSYTVYTRPTTRHKFKPEKFYSRLNQRESTIQSKDLEIQPRIIQEAKEIIKERIQQLDCEVQP